MIKIKYELKKRSAVCTPFLTYTGKLASASEVITSTAVTAENGTIATTEE